MSINKTAIVFIILMSAAILTSALFFFYYKDINNFDNMHADISDALSVDNTCCMEPACTICGKEANEWNNFEAGKCACGTLVAQGKKPCPGCLGAGHSDTGDSNKFYG